MSRLNTVFLFIFKTASPELNPNSQKNVTVTYETHRQSTFYPNVMFKKVKLSFKNVNKEENKREALFLLADKVSNHDDI